MNRLIRLMEFHIGYLFHIIFIIGSEESFRVVNVLSGGCSCNLNQHFNYQRVRVSARVMQWMDGWEDMIQILNIIQYIVTFAFN